MFRPLWIEIDLKSLRDNFYIVKKILGKKVKIMAIIKQNAYGHGSISIAKELSFCGVDFFGVGSLEEAISLRRERLRESILVLSPYDVKTSSYFLEYKVTPTIVDLKFAKILNKKAKEKNLIFPVHIKVDTGMGRLGLCGKEAIGFIEKISYLKNLSLEGLYTHLSCADTDERFTCYQINTFKKLIEDLRKKGLIFKFYHCANSCAILNYPESHFNMVRCGLILYGIKPTPKIKIDFKPVLSLKSKIIFIKKVKKGWGISYGRTFIAKKDTLVGVICVGYADGYLWNLSNHSKVIIKDDFFKLIGRVCMDYIMVDLKNREDIKVGEEVILIGKKKNRRILAEDLSFWAKTIPYEITSRLSLKIPHIYKNSLLKSKNK